MRPRNPVQPAGRFQNVVRERQGVAAARAAADDDGDELVVAEAGGAKRNSFSRGRSLTDRAFMGKRYTQS